VPPEAGSSLAGLDVGALTEWIERTRPPGLSPTGPLRTELITGGRSNLTYRITDGTRTWVLRRPPLGHVLPTAHDMSREFRVISALADTDVPVPVPLALCTDADVIGAPFYVMDLVAGTVLDEARLAGMDAAAAGRVSAELLDTLVALHTVDPERVGLGDFGRPDGFLHRQLARWHAQSLASQQSPRELEEAVSSALTATAPADGRSSIVHGDYRLTNVLFDTDNKIVAVVDWEMATLGDPLTDVGLLYVYHRLSEDGAAVMPAMPAANGFLSPAQLLGGYAERSGHAHDDIWWYVAFGYYKLAVICEGIAARYAQGMTLGSGFKQFAALVPVLLSHAEQTVRTKDI
jgi:aminoglycoside phosphotransferase (APT) family kinase protein